MTRLPSVELLINRCKALAALDLVLSPDWEYRRYSFNAHWAEGEMMASMRDGSGDEWWMVFHRAGWAALKGLEHEGPAWRRHGETLSLALQHAFPREMQGFSNEAAFRWNETSFAYFFTAGAVHWTYVNALTDYATEATRENPLLAHIVGDATDYAAFAADYYETEIEEQTVAGIFAFRPITPDIVTRLNRSASLQDIAEELYGEIAYPRPGMGEHLQRGQRATGEGGPPAGR